MCIRDRDPPPEGGGAYRHRARTPGPRGAQPVSPGDERDGEAGPAMLRPPSNPPGRHLVLRRAVLVLATLCANAALAQNAPKLELPRPSPKASVTQTVGLTDISIAYSSPAVKGRRIWGEVVPFDQPWRAGANECTKMTFSTPVSIEGKPVAAGAYCLVLLPQKSGWTFILSKSTELWGADEYKQSAAALRVPATATTIPLRERL